MKKLLSAILTLTTAIAMAMSMTVTASAAKNGKPSAAKLSVRYTSKYEDVNEYPGYAIMFFKQDNGSTTYFTLDGSKPSKKNGFKYEGGTFGIQITYEASPIKYITYTNGNASSVMKYEFKQYKTDELNNPWDVFYGNAVSKKWTSAEKKAVRKAYENLKVRLYEYYDEYMQMAVERFGCPAVEWSEDFTDEEDELWSNFHYAARKKILQPYLSGKEYTGNPYSYELDGAYYPYAAYNDDYANFDPEKLIKFYNSFSEKYFLPFDEEDIPDRIYSDLVKKSYTDSVWDDVVSPTYVLEGMNLPTFLYEGEVLTPELTPCIEKGEKFLASNCLGINVCSEEYLDVNTLKVKYTNLYDRSKKIKMYIKYAYQCTGFYRPYDQLTDEEKELVGDYIVP